MRKRIQGLAIGLVVGILLASSTAFAKQAAENAKIHYKDIKVYVDGAEVVPKGSDGSIVEPFIMNGATYLPVRAISNALGQDVEWDGKTQSVYIGKKNYLAPDNYLHKIQYTNYRESYVSSDFTIINGTITDYNNTSYTNGLLFRVHSYGSGMQDEPDGCNTLISYPLNSQYSVLKGKIVLPKTFKLTNWGESVNNVETSDVYFYGDGKLLYKATSVTTSMPFDLDIDVEGVNELTVKIKSNDNWCYIALTDLALYE